ncbi:uncharacterized protein LOC121308924 [Polyodon spathula]|uniref:uncharacterized protein LOC121308924 n=1 Tax=Polyodon spathula TaxID=7913 RepID=UPI001B7EDFE0|nr:uncharacterized protein LOC121308924 [Polyodon spathula]
MEPGDRRTRYCQVAHSGGVPSVCRGAWNRNAWARLKQVCAGGNPSLLNPLQTKKKSTAFQRFQKLRLQITRELAGTAFGDAHNSRSRCAGSAYFILFYFKRTKLSFHASFSQPCVSPGPASNRPSLKQKFQKTEVRNQVGAPPPFAVAMTMVAPTTTMGPEETTALPVERNDSIITAVVIVLVLLTLLAMGFLLYHYLCKNKGAYKTAGEPDPGDDMDLQSQLELDQDQKKEYYI